jgi:signal transduction histidine kinase
MTTMTETPLQLRRAQREEQLATHAARLARRNQALDDFAALVAHDVRSSLIAALKADEPRDGLARALELVESILDAVRAEGARGTTDSVAECARCAIEDLGLVDASLVVAPGGGFAIPAAALRVALRNLFTNAIAAGATKIEVKVLADNDRSALIIDDDGCGLSIRKPHSAGAGLGLWLCRRLLDRFDASLELVPLPASGARAMIIRHAVQ